MAQYMHTWIQNSVLLQHEVAQIVQSLLRPNNYVIIKHDLSIVNYLSDFICCLYGKPGAYCVVTLAFSIREGINIFLVGFVSTENLRFKNESLTFKVAETPQKSAEEIKSYAWHKYPNMCKTNGSLSFSCGMQPDSAANWQFRNHFITSIGYRCRETKQVTWVAGKMLVREVKLCVITKSPH